MQEDFIQSIKDKKQQKQQTDEELSRHQQVLDGNTQVQEAVLNMARAIIEANIQHQPDVSVKNFPQQLATSEDVQALVEAFKQTQTETVETTENTSQDLKSVLNAILGKLGDISTQDHTSDVITAIASLEEEAKDKDVTVSNLDDMADFFFSLEQAIDRLKLDVKVEKPDLAPLTKEMAEVKKAIKGIPQPEIPEMQFPTEIFMGILDELQEHRMLLQKILSRPIPVGSGGAIGTGTASSTPETGPGASIDNLLLETGDNLLLESGATDVLQLA